MASLSQDCPGWTLFFSAPFPGFHSHVPLVEAFVLLGLIDSIAHF
jgi:hypothetical protein